MCMVAGPNGAGKTTLWMEHLKAHLEGMFSGGFINADEMQKGFSEELLKAPDVERFAQAAAAKLRNDLLESPFQKSFIYETVFSDEQGFKLSELMKGRERGYVTALIFVGVDDVELSKARVQIRVAKGGHNVKPKTQEARFDRVLRNAAKAIPVVDLVLFIDNSRDADLGASGGRYKGQSVYKRGRLLGQATVCQNWHTRVLAMHDSMNSGLGSGTADSALPVAIDLLQLQYSPGRALTTLPQLLAFPPFKSIESDEDSSGH